ncbi:MAG TPA: response regulator transcription factor [Candidatus Baltobacteraceae bacterium]|nr:response regulator transcription factor [Candidatus Baltobacteraceae bacterium]
MSITVSIVEDNRETREALAARVNQSPSLRCLNTYANAELALHGIPADKPDVALVDINLPGMSGIECVAKLKEQLPQLPMLMITTYEEAELIFNSLRAGAKGYLLKNTPPAELVQAIEQVHAGGAPMSMQIARKVVDHFHRVGQSSSEMEQLSKREEEVLALLSKGLLYKEIGDALNISLATVRTHLHHIYEKLHVQSRTEATVKFLNRD